MNYTLTFNVLGANALDIDNKAENILSTFTDDDLTGWDYGWNAKPIWKETGDTLEIAGFEAEVRAEFSA